MYAGLSGTTLAIMVVGDKGLPKLANTTLKIKIATTRFITGPANIVRNLDQNGLL